MTAISLNNKDNIFDYNDIIEPAWDILVKDAQNFQKIHFDLENNETTGEKKKIIVKVNGEPYTFTCELFYAGGDWEIGANYFRIELPSRLTYKLIHNKPIEYIWDVIKKPTMSRRHYVVIPPNGHGNTLKKNDNDSWSSYEEENEIPGGKIDNKKDRKLAWKFIIDLLTDVANKRIKNLNENYMKDTIDTITMDVPLFIRMLEYAKEDAKTDMDLHSATQKALELSKGNEKLTMDNYDGIVGSTKKIETTESTDASASGSVEGSTKMPIIKKNIITKLHNYESEETSKKFENRKGEVTEVTDASVSASGSYDAPFPGMGKNKLGIGGPESINKSMAVKKPGFPKLGGPGGVFIKIKDKCKTFPYCNQGDINNIEVLKESINEVATKLNIPISEVEKIVINEINKIFIEDEK